MGWTCSTSWGGVLIGHWWESQNVRDHWKDQDVGGCTLLKWSLEI
jgi:hypothetical protein